MNAIVNKLLLGGDKFMPELDLRFKETGDSRYIYQNELDKACFQYDMAYAGFKDLTRRTPAGKYYVLGIKALCDEAFNIAKNTKYEEYQRGLSSMVYKFLDKKNSGGTVTKENISNKELKAIEIQKIIIGKFEKRKVH